jgi:tetratricopeptide (TPR) repeat protein
MGLYLGLGSPDALDAGHQQARANPFNSNSVSTGRSGTSVASVGTLVDGLKSRLAQETDDAGGWLLLARSYEHLGRYQDATDAYERAKSLGKADSDLEKTLLAGRVVASTSTNIDPLPSIRGRVTLSPESASQVNPDDTIFIFAKESPEHRMPVVALRKPATELPIDFVLTDAQEMVAGTHLGDYETLVVTARVSRSGLATDSVAGLEAWSDPVSPMTGSEISLLITTNSQAGISSDE